MIYGLRTKSATGVVELDENSFTVRIVYSALIPRSAGRFVDISIPEVEPEKYSAVCVPVAPYNTSGQSWDAICFIPEVTPGNVRVWFGNRQSNDGPLGTATQRLLVMRYK